MSKKIGNYEAHNIANKVAAKAFEHLITPAQERLNQIAMAAYTQELQDCGVTQQIEAQLRARKVTDNPYHHTDTCTLVYGNKDAGEDDASYGLEFPEGERPLFAQMVLTNDYNKDQIQAAYQALAPLEIKKGALAYDIRTQITGKTTAVVRKHWPEITGFVEDVMREGINTNNISPVPFQTLLNTHLLALAAPTTAPAA